MRKLLLVPILLMLVMLATSCLPMREFTQTEDKLGTYATITIYDRDSAKAKNALIAGFKEIDRLKDVLSTYKPGTPAHTLNEQGFLTDPALELLYVIKKAELYSVKSGGAFDISVAPILNYYKYIYTMNETEDQDKINEALFLIGYQNITADKEMIKFQKPGMKVTISGIAKGYIVDKVIDTLKERGIQHALVNIGGDMRALGNKGRKDWMIALQNPRDENDFITKIELNDKAIATSGDYERFFVDDKSVHHIIDPRTGGSATELISVTIVADKAIDADAIATAVFVLGKDRGLKFVDSLGEVEALIITADKDIIQTADFSKKPTQYEQSFAVGNGRRVEYGNEGKS